MLRVGLLIVFVCLALSTCAVSQEFHGCGPLYLDPHTFGGAQADFENRSEFCNATHLRVEGDTYDLNYAKGWRALKDREWFGVLPKCKQVAIGVSINQNVDGGLRGNNNSVGISLNSNMTYWGDPEEPTEGGLNQNFTDRLVYAGKKSHWPGMWIMVNTHTNQLWYAHPGMEPISFDLPEIFDGKDLYPHVQVWNSKSLEILHEKPLLSHNCTNSLLINKQSFNGSIPLTDNPLTDNPLTDNRETLIVSGLDAGDLGVVKLGGVLIDGQWIAGIAKLSAGPGIGVSAIPYKSEEYFRNFFGNPEYNLLLHTYSRIYDYADLDPSEEVALFVKVDYAAGSLSYVVYRYYGEDSFPFRDDTLSLPEAIRNKPLFPVFMVSRGNEIAIERDVSENLARILQSSY